MANIKDILNKVQFCIEEDTEAIAGILVTMVGFPHTLWPNTLADVEALGDKLIERGARLKEQVKELRGQTPVCSGTGTEICSLPSREIARNRGFDSTQKCC